MVEKSSVADRPTPLEKPKSAFSIAGKQAKVDLDMGEGSRLQGFKLNGSR